MIEHRKQHRYRWWTLLMVALFAIQSRTAVDASGNPPLSPPPFEPLLVVSPHGDDTNPGTSDAPLATIEAALRRLPPPSRNDGTNRLIALRGGIHELRAPLTLSHIHRGVTLQAWPGEQPVLSGGRRMINWRMIDEGLWAADLPAHLTPGQWPRAVYLDGRRLREARFPSQGTMAVHEVSDGGRTIRFSESLPAAPEDDPGELVVRLDWSTTRVPLSQVTEHHIHAPLPVAAPHRVNGVRADRRAYLVGSRAYLTEPYEWVIDRREHMLLIKLPLGMDPSRHQVIVPVLEQLLVIEGRQGEPVRDVTLSGLMLMHANWSPPTEGYRGRQATHFNNAEHGVVLTVPPAVWLAHVSNIRLERVAVQQVSGGGIALGPGTHAVVLHECLIDNVGGNGVMVGWRTRDASVRLAAIDKDWDDPRDVPTGNVISNSVIRRAGREYNGAVGLWVAFAADTVIEQNLIRDLPYTGISLGFRWTPAPSSMRGTRVVGNRIHNVMRVLADGGGIYTLGSQPDTLLQANIIHGVRRHSHAQGSHNNGLFIDEGTRHLTIVGNIVYDTTGNPMRFHRAKREEQTIGENAMHDLAAPPPGIDPQILEMAGPSRSMLDWAAAIMSVDDEPDTPADDEATDITARTEDS